MKKVLGLMSTVLVAVALASVNTASWLVFYYQPKAPKSLLK